jgi:methylaspartate ammonia-lyase
MAEAIQDEYQTDIEIAVCQCITQSGDERYSNVDKMILKRRRIATWSWRSVGTKLGRMKSLRIVIKFGARIV